MVQLPTWWNTRHWEDRQHLGMKTPRLTDLHRNEPTKSYLKVARYTNYTIYWLGTIDSSYFLSITILSLCRFHWNAMNSWSCKRSLLDCFLVIYPSCIFFFDSGLLFWYLCKKPGETRSSPPCPSLTPRPKAPSKPLLRRLRLHQKYDVQQVYFVPPRLIW